MLKHYGDNAQAEGPRRVDQLAEEGDHAGVAIWMRIIDAIGELVEHDCSRTCTLTERPLRSARPVSGMRLRMATVTMCLLDAALWALVAFVMFHTGLDPVTSGPNEAGGCRDSTVPVTAAPARALTLSVERQKTALTLALVFLTAFAAMFIYDGYSVFLTASSRGVSADA